MNKLRVFVSSVQKELEDERLIVQNLINTDTFLSSHCLPVLYEFEPASPEKALEGCLIALDGCQIYLLIVAVQYGSLVGELSIGLARREGQGRSTRYISGNQT
jgi:ATP-dependent DNA helicase RecG